MVTLLKKLAVLSVFALLLPASAQTSKVNSDANLFDLQEYDETNFTAEQVEYQNRQTLAELRNVQITRVVPSPKGPRLNGLTKEWVTAVVDSINRHPVVSLYHYEKYNQPGYEIGFCFGRAAYAHLALLKMGVNKDAIRKAFIVGRMNAGGVEWIYHVTTLVKDYTTNTWWAVDDYPGKILSADQWYEYMNSQRARGAKLRLFITDAEKFAPNTGKYDRVSLGLGLPKGKDWFRSYFNDLMHWFRNNSIEEVGLRDLR